MDPVSTPLLGWTFSPPDRELTDVYLPRELAGHPVPVAAHIFHHVDIYSADPERLVEGRAHAPGTGKVGVPPVWHFLSPVRSASGRKNAVGRKARVVAGCDRGETWHVENKKPVKGSAIGRHVRTFTYSKKSTSGDCLERLGWIMKEYDIPPQNGGGHRVLCKIYRTPRKNSRAPSSSFATTAAESDGSESRKRKAAGDHPETPTPGARPPQTGDKVDFTEKLQHASMEGSGESEASDFYRTTTCMPAGETELRPRTQETFLPASGFYGTTTHMPSTCDFEELLLREDDFQAPEEEIQAMMIELSREMPSTCKIDFDLKEWQLLENDFHVQEPEDEIEFDWEEWQLLDHDYQFQLPGTEEEIKARILEMSRDMAS